MDSVPSLEHISHCLAEQVLEKYCLCLGTGLMRCSFHRSDICRYDS